MHMKTLAFVMAACCVFAQPAKAEMETAAIAMFKKRDRNGDGFITVDEMGKRRDK